MQDNLGASSSFDDAVAISARLKENMDAEGRCSNECFVEVLAMLSPLQQVRRRPAPGAPVMQSSFASSVAETFHQTRSQPRSKPAGPAECHTTVCHLLLRVGLVSGSRGGG
jgi:hypothetical protein